MSDDYSIIRNDGGELARCWCDLESCGPVAYRWVCATSGNVIFLCVSCCAAWRANANESSLLRPSRITQVTP